MFIVIVLEEDLAHEGEMALIVVCTIALSILAHGLTANPWSRAFGKRERRREGREA